MFLHIFIEMKFTPLGQNFINMLPPTSLHPLKWVRQRLCALCYIKEMPRGASGRIVINIDPNLKRALYIKLAQTNSSLKSWFIEKAEKASVEPPENAKSLALISEEPK